jgi:transposase
MNYITYVGLDVHKATVCVAIAESGRGGEVREVGIFENQPDVLRKMVARLGKHRRRLNFCYEAGPCGYGLHRLLTGLGHDCVVVAPSLIPIKAGEGQDRSPRRFDAGEAASCRRTDADLDTRRCP